MATRNPMRFLQANPKLTSELRVTLAIAADEMATNESAITAAMRDPTTRRELKQLVNDLAELLAVIHTESVEPKFAARRIAAAAAKESH